MSTEDGKGYIFTDGDYEAVYWADPAPDGSWHAWIESNFTLNRDLPSGLRSMSRLYRSEDEATAAARENIEGEVLWWRRRNDSFFDGEHQGVAYRVLATRLGLPAEEGWKCVIQYDKPLQNGYGTEHEEMFKSSEQAISHGKEIATHVIGEILRHLSLSEEDALREAKARFVRLADIPAGDL